MLGGRWANVPTAPRELADADDGAGATQTLDVARDLGVPQRELEAECHRLGVHAVRAADHRRAAMFERAIANRVGKPVEVGQQDVARLTHLQRLRRVDDVRRRHAEVEPARRRSDFFGDRRRKGNDVVLGGLFDFFDARDVESTALADVARRFGRHDAGGRHGVGGGSLHEQPGLVPALVAPDAAHFRVCIAWDHRR